MSIIEDINEGRILRGEEPLGEDEDEILEEKDFEDDDEYDEDDEPIPEDK